MKIAQLNVQSQPLPFGDQGVFKSAISPNYPKTGMPTSWLRGFATSLPALIDPEVAKSPFVCFDRSHNLNTPATRFKHVDARGVQHWIVLWFLAAGQQQLIYFGREYFDYVELLNHPYLVNEPGEDAVIDVAKERFLVNLSSQHKLSAFGQLPEGLSAAKIQPPIQIDDLFCVPTDHPHFGVASKISNKLKAEIISIIDDAETLPALSDNINKCLKGADRAFLKTYRPSEHTETLQEFADGIALHLQNLGLHPEDQEFHFYAGSITKQGEVYAFTLPYRENDPRSAVIEEFGAKLAAEMIEKEQLHHLIFGQNVGKMFRSELKYATAHQSVDSYNRFRVKYGLT